MNPSYFRIKTDLESAINRLENWNKKAFFEKQQVEYSEAVKRKAGLFLRICRVFILLFRQSLGWFFQVIMTLFSPDTMMLCHMVK